jgi:hypothetical protein
LDQATDSIDYHLNSEAEDIYPKIQMEAVYNGDSLFDGKILKSPRSIGSGPYNQPQTHKIQTREQGQRGGNQDEDDYTISEMLIMKNNDKSRRKSVKHHDNQTDINTDSFDLPSPSK